MLFEREVEKLYAKGIRDFDALKPSQFMNLALAFLRDGADRGDFRYKKWLNDVLAIKRLADKNKKRRQLLIERQMQLIAPLRTDLQAAWIAVISNE